MENLAHSAKKAASAVTKGASNAASTVSKGAHNAATSVSKGASNAVESATKGVSSGAHVVAKGVTTGVKSTSSAVTKGVANTSSVMSNAMKRQSSISGGLTRMSSARRSMVTPDADLDPKNVSGCLKGLIEHRVTASVKDLDHYRKHGLMAIATDYIIRVRCVTADGEPEFGFVMSKTFSSFRTLANELYKQAEEVMISSANLPKKIIKLAKYCHAVLQLVESQNTEYLGKVNYGYVQTLAKQRSQIIDVFLQETMTNFPDQATCEQKPFARNIAIILEKFFLTDHCESVEGDGEDDVFGTIINQPIKKNYHNVEKNFNAKDGTAADDADMDASVSPYSVRSRRSKETRLKDMKELQKSEASLYLEGDDPKKGKAGGKKVSPVVKIATLVDDKPIMAVAGFAGAMQILRQFDLSVEVGVDVILVIAFSAFCLGVHALRFLGLQQKGSSRQNADATLMTKMPSARGGVAGEEGGEEAAETIPSPMPRFPEGAKLGSVLNCWSDPPSTVFNVRGDFYLTDKKKIKSGPFLFKNRGLDLFLTDTCPENVGRIPSLLHGELRSVPTFIINFRLPWGVLLCYSEIPDRFVPFIKGCYGDETFSKDLLEASMKEMSNPDRCCARFLLGDADHKNKTLKIFPAVVEGPWVVKASVGGKPAIIGTKLPVDWKYQPESEGIDGTKQALYLEADLDIVSSSAARGVLSLVRSYTQELTMDLGFGIQGNHEDELPEQMLVGTRVHGIDPLNAPPLPPLTETLFAAPGGADRGDGGSDSDSDDE